MINYSFAIVLNILVGINGFIMAAASYTNGNMGWFAAHMVVSSGNLIAVGVLIYLSKKKA